jgi:hypothetical protein
MRRTTLVLRMNWLIRRFAALVAIYSIALQALLSGFVIAAHVRFDSFAVICTTSASSGHEPSIPQHGSECVATCIAVWSDSPVLPAASVAFSPVSFAKRAHGTRAMEVPPLESRHHPQEFPPDLGLPPRSSCVGVAQ